MLASAYRPPAYVLKLRKDNPCSDVTFALAWNCTDDWWSGSRRIDESLYSVAVRTKSVQTVEHRETARILSSPSLVRHVSRLMHEDIHPPAGRSG